jgi:hypothetical protein
MPTSSLDLAKLEAFQPSRTRAHMQSTLENNVSKIHKKVSKNTSENDSEIT